MGIDKRNLHKSKTMTVSSDSVGGFCSEGMTTSELLMVRRLAGNDPVLRKKTLKKLKKWLNVLSQKIPDIPESRAMVEPNFVRIWKALFYCMWMADKPLPQEQLADSISDLQNIFADKTQPFLLFVEWFLRTIGREWSWIDRFRLDKFMMLFRRFLRKSLVILATRKWHNDVTEGFLKLVSMYIFNRHPVSKKKKREERPSAPITMAPLGLQIHFVDIFMEELAKVGGETMKFSKILKIMKIFIHELAYNSDDRVLDEIRERIFNHLMRQSDIGIDYQEQVDYNNVDDEDQEVDINLDELEEELEEIMPDDEEYEMEMQNGQLDPRAGAVDVILPQIDIDYDVLYKKLIEFGGQKDVKLKNRRILYNLASQFKELTEGIYPLAIPEDDTNKPAIRQKEIKKAAKRLAKLENEEGVGKRRKTKKERKREARRRQSLESIGSEDSSQYINDNDLLEHVTDNYMSYLEEEVKQKQTEDVEDEIDGKESTQNDILANGESKVSKKSKKTKDSPRKEKGTKRKWKTVVEVEADEDDVEDNVNASNETEETLVIKKPKLKKRNSLGNNSELKTPPKGKVRRVSELRLTPINKSSPLNSSLTNSGSRRVSFVLAKNLEHAHADYPVSIARSPAIPYDKNKRPSFGLLKSPATPNTTPQRRMSALDFF